VSNRALLVLEDGTVFTGRAFGAAARGEGEVVFSTAMTGYQEMLTDPSYAGQILALTYPLVGNYGVNAIDVESRRIQVRGFVVREECPLPSHWQSTGTVHEYLASQGIPGIAGVDTRALTRRLRSAGVMMGTITADETPEKALARLRGVPDYDSIDFVRRVSTEEPYDWQSPEAARYRIVVVDSGVKYNIMRLLRARGCSVTTMPCTATAEDILTLGPDGILFSPGPGDPALLDYLVGTVSSLMGKAPMLGICLGHQVIGRAFGARTFKLKFGHRGANHPVKDLLSGRVYITSQNHGYAIDPDGLTGGAEVSHVNLNDGTVEGLWHRSLPVITIQYHSEASPGPQDNVYIFDRFLEMVETLGQGLGVKGQGTAQNPGPGAKDRG
jgi:carbamoyl-phosphate synthase small subunit